MTLKWHATLKSFGQLYIFLIAFYIFTLTVSCLLPSHFIRYNISKSFDRFYSEGVYPSPILHSPFAMQDNYTDAVMLNTAYNIDNFNPFISAISAKQSNTGQPLESLAATVKNPETNSTFSYYPRYWHGYLIVLRPLLCFFDYMEIRQINIALILGLFATLAAVSYKSYGFKAAFSLVMGLILVNIIVVPFSIQFMSVFVISLLATIIILARENLDSYWFSRALFVSGSLTAFLDLLTAPVLTLCFPLLAILILYEKKNPILDFHSGLRLLLLLSASWFFGYFLTWLAKWIIVYMYALDDGVVSAIKYRLGLLDEKSVAYKVVEKNIAQIGRFIMITLIIILMLLRLQPNRQKDSPMTKLYLICACIPWVWYMALSNHSYIHYWFTYRAQAATISGMLLAMDIRGLRIKEWKDRLLKFRGYLAQS